MNRTLGFFLGSAVVFVMLVLVLGQPVSLAPPADRDQPRGPDAMATTVSGVVAEPAVQPAEPSSLRSSIAPVKEPTAPSPVAQLPATALVAAPAADVVSPSALMADSEAATTQLGIERQDENKLVESWLASAAVPRADDIDAASATSVEEASLAAGSTDEPAVAEAPEIEWFPVWDPFHSELSANAFARRLERVTGLDYRVIKTAPAQYRVTVGYTSEEQRIANLNLIEEATGLTVTGVSL